MTPQNWRENRILRALFFFFRAKKNPTASKLDDLIGNEGTEDPRKSASPAPFPFRVVSDTPEGSVGCDVFFPNTLSHKKLLVFQGWKISDLFLGILRPNMLFVGEATIHYKQIFGGPRLGNPI